MKSNFIRKLVGIVACAISMISCQLQAQSVYVGYYNQIQNYVAPATSGTPLATDLAGVSGMAFDTNGNLFVSLYDDNTIAKISPSGVLSTFAAATTPRALAFDSTGNLYTTAISGGQRSIIKITPSGVSSVFSSSSLANPEALAFDSFGNLFVTNEANNSVVKFSPAGVGSVFISTSLSQPIGLAFDSSGTLYVSNFGDSSIRKFNSSGVGTIFSQRNNQVYGPQDIAFDAANNLYVCNRNNFSVGVITPSGVGSHYASNGSNVPGHLAIQSVPEPREWAMFALLGPLVLALWRRNSSKIKGDGHLYSIHQFLNGERCLSRRFVEVILIGFRLGRTEVKQDQQAQCPAVPFMGIIAGRTLPQELVWR